MKYYTFLFAILLSISTAFAVSCGDVLTESVDLLEDLNCSDDGLTIGANDVILNCNDHVIRGDGSGTGILMQDFSELSVSHCTVENFQIGIQQGVSIGSDGSSVAYNTIDSCDTGIKVVQSSTNVIIENEITDSAVHGVHVVNSNNNQFYSNTITGAQGSGIYVDNSNNNYFYDNYLANAVNAFDNSNNNWNVPQKTKRNVVDGPNTGGNYWGDFGLEGQGCLDDNYDSFCDDTVAIGSNTDNLPLKKDWIPDPGLPPPVPTNNTGEGGASGEGEGSGGAGGPGSEGSGITPTPRDSSTTNPDNTQPTDSTDGSANGEDSEGMIPFNEDEELNKNDFLMFILIIVVVAVLFIGYMLSKSRSR